jgi:hypothetical protein
VRDDYLCLPAGLVWHGPHYTGARVPYAARVLVLKTLHVFGAIFLVGGVTTQALLRPMAARVEPIARQALYDLAWRVQISMVYIGSGLVLITGILLWITEQLKLFTGWLLLGFLLYAAAAGLDGALLAPSLRRARAAGTEEGAQAVAALVTVQLVAWLLLLIVLFLMVTRPF